VFSEEKLPMKNIAVFAIFRDRLHAEAAVKEPNPATALRPAISSSAIWQREFVSEVNGM
jgi:hypothetical protein